MWELETWASFGCVLSWDYSLGTMMEGWRRKLQWLSLAPVSPVRETSPGVRVWKEMQRKSAGLTADYWLYM